MKFYTYWRSLATLRVRIALNLKGIETDKVFVDLVAGHQLQPEFKAINPQGALPALVLDDGTVLFQSMAILEYLDEVYPMPRLMPDTAKARARVRGLAQIAVADAHPLVVPRVRHYLGKELGLTDAQQTAWSRHWMASALAAMEGHLANNPETGLYCQGNQLSLADICLVSQVVGLGYFGGTTEAFPTVARIHARCMENEAIAAAHPLQQPGAPKT